MKKWVSVIMAGLISLSLTGCSLLFNGEKKEAAKPAPKQEQSQSNKPQENEQQNQDSANADSGLEDSQSLEVDSMTVYVDDRTWTPQPEQHGGYEMFPNASSFDQALEGILVRVQQQPFPRLDENATEEIIKGILNAKPSDDLTFETLKSESDEIMIRFQMKRNGLVGEGFMRFFGNDQKSGLVVYITAKNTSEEEMKKWQKRIEAARFADSF